MDANDQAVGRSFIYDASNKGYTTVVNEKRMRQQQAQQPQMLVNERGQQKLLPVAGSLVDLLQSSEVTGKMQAQQLQSEQSLQELTQLSEELGLEF